MPKTKEDKTAYNREWRRKNRDKVNAAARARRLKNIDKERAKSRDYARSRRLRNPKAVRDYAHKNYLKNADKVKAQVREWRAKNLERSKQSQRNRWQKRLYGITLAEKQALFQLQGSVCACCGGSDPGSDDWQTEHDHNTKTIRGVTCRPCNIAIGVLGDTLEAARVLYGKIERYLTHSQADTLRRLIVIRGRG